MQERFKEVKAYGCLRSRTEYYCLILNRIKFHEKSIQIVIVCICIINTRLIGLKIAGYSAEDLKVLNFEFFSRFLYIRIM